MTLSIGCSYTNQGKSLRRKRVGELSETASCLTIFLEAKSCLLHGLPNTDWQPDYFHEGTHSALQTTKLFTKHAGVMVIPGPLPSNSYSLHHAVQDYKYFDDCRIHAIFWEKNMVTLFLVAGSVISTVAGTQHSYNLALTCCQVPE